MKYIALLSKYLYNYYLSHILHVIKGLGIHVSEITGM